MKKRGSSSVGIIFRAGCFLIAGVMTSMAFLGVADTHSWFTSQAKANLEVSAATTEDIVEIIGLEYSGKDNKNPEFIVLKGSENLMDKEAILYFEVVGSIGEYILHINPVLIEANKEYKIPIEANVNLRQHVELLDFLWKDKLIQGKIRIKYLNEFINEEIEIAFTGSYLRNKLLEEIKRKEVEVREYSITADIETRGEITTLIAYLAGQLDWVEENTSVEALMDVASTRTIRSSGDLVKTAEEDAEGVMGVAFETVPIERYELSVDQSSIISIIAPTLQGYLDRAYNIIVDLVARLNEKLAVIAELSQALEDFRLKSEGLEGENSRLMEENEGLRETIVKLEEALHQASSKEETINPTPNIPPDSTTGDASADDAKEETEIEPKEKTNEDEEAIVPGEVIEEQKKAIEQEPLMEEGPGEGSFN